MGIGMPLVIVVFYLYLLVRPQHVKGPLALRIGLLGVCLIAFTQFIVPLSADPGRAKTVVVLQAVGALVGLVAAMYACRVPPIEPPWAASAKSEQAKDAEA